MTEAETLSTLVSWIDATPVDKSSIRDVLRYYDSSGRTPDVTASRWYTVGLAAAAPLEPEMCAGMRIEWLVTIYYPAAPGVDARAAGDLAQLVRRAPVLHTQDPDIYTCEAVPSGIEEDNGQIRSLVSYVITYRADALAGS